MCSTIASIDEGDNFTDQELTEFDEEHKKWCDATRYIFYPYIMKIPAHGNELLCAMCCDHIEHGSSLPWVAVVI